MIRRILIFAIFVVPAGSCIAEEFNGTKLYEWCISKTSSSADIACSAFIGGVASGLALGQAMPAKGLRFCPPAKLATKQARLVIEKYMRDHPEQLNERPEVFSAEALLQAFPCPNSN